MIINGSIKETYIDVEKHKTGRSGEGLAQKPWISRGMNEGLQRDLGDGQSRHLPEGPRVSGSPGRCLESPRVTRGMDGADACQKPEARREV